MKLPSKVLARQYSSSGYRYLAVSLGAVVCLQLRSSMLH